MEFTYSDEFAREMVDWHIAKAVDWQEHRALKISLGERDLMLAEFRSAQDSAFHRLKSKLLPTEGAHRDA